MYSKKTKAICPKWEELIDLFVSFYRAKICPSIILIFCLLFTSKKSLFLQQQNGYDYNLRKNK